MDEEKMRRVVHSQRHAPYLATFAAFAGAIGCIKHLIHLHQWDALIFMGFGYAALIALIVFFWRHRHQGENIAVRYIAGVGLSSVCLISVISDFAIGLLKQ